MALACQTRRMGEFNKFFGPEYEKDLEEIGYDSVYAYVREVSVYGCHLDGVS